MPSCSKELARLSGSHHAKLYTSSKSPGLAVFAPTESLGSNNATAGTLLSPDINDLLSAVDMRLI
jgi:hypothetical protein